MISSTLSMASKCRKIMVYDIRIFTNSNECNTMAREFAIHARCFAYSKIWLEEHPPLFSCWTNNRTVSTIIKEFLIDGRRNSATCSNSLLPQRIPKTPFVYFIQWILSLFSRNNSFIFIFIVF